MAVPPSSTARNEANWPPYRPIGVRANPAMTLLMVRRVSALAGLAHPVAHWIAVKLLNLDHVAIAVENLDEAVAAYRKKYGVSPIYRETVESQGVEEAMIPVGGSFVQLLGALGPDTPVGKFLAERGEGLHHVAFAVADIEAALSHLEGEGARLIDPSPRPGGRGARIAFVHPKDLVGTMVELVELPDG